MMDPQQAPGGLAQRTAVVRHSRQGQRPPAGRSRVSLGLTAAASRGNALHLQTCQACGATQYPPQECCANCLSDQLTWRQQPAGGELLAQTTLRHSNHPYFGERLPWRIGTIRLDAGPTVVAFLTASVPHAPARVRVSLRMDRAGEAVLIGQPASEAAMHPDEKLQQETGCDPRGRRVLVSDGTTPLGQALVRGLVEAGCETVWAGHPRAGGDPPALEMLSGLAGVHLVPLDVTIARSVSELGRELQGKVDIVFHHAELHRSPSMQALDEPDVARADMESSYFGLMRLAQAFAPSLQAVAMQGASHRVAWVNILSIFALNNHPARSSYSAAQAAALSQAQRLRAQLQPHGIRVLNIFPGPLDDDGNLDLPAPKLSPSALAAAALQALTQGVEDAYPGEVAQEWLRRWLANPKALEREVAQGGP